ncbi:hypothetical protein GMOD_00004804 [Pyrenophora seminiperda CCB06]|uniref:Uncharacterized protein n=1 Tax=Pyrenophora seminiperda CCB06 TaxID=1302712 RepID=A0A3M7MHR0_9PLEO|nr:hypothetical protein GMOD_00004804 [Pyrenophora seminiperda CCB06]
MAPYGKAVSASSSHNETLAWFYEARINRTLIAQFERTVYYRRKSIDMELRCFCVEEVSSGHTLFACSMVAYRCSRLNTVGLRCAKTRVSIEPIQTQKK